MHQEITRNKCLEPKTRVPGRDSEFISKNQLRPLVSIIVVNWNGLKHIDECLKSLLDQIYSPIEIILVDNCSEDGSVEFVRKNFSGAPRLLSSFLQIGIYARSAASYTKRFFRYLLYPLIDILLLYLSMILSVNLRFETFPNREYMIIISVYVLVWLSLLLIQGLYSKKYFLELVDLEGLRIWTKPAANLTRW